MTTVGRRRAVQAALLAAVLSLALAGDASACPVCYGEADGSMIDGAKLSVAFLGALVYGVLGGGAALVVAARRRAGRLGATADPRHGMRLVPDDDPATGDDEA